MSSNGFTLTLTSVVLKILLVASQVKHEQHRTAASQPLLIDCDEDLGLESGWLTPTQFSATSFLTDGDFDHHPSNSRLNAVNRGFQRAGWRPQTHGSEEYIQVDLELPHNVSKICTQGSSKEFIDKFKLNFSLDGYNWSGLAKEFEVASPEATNNTLEGQVLARFVRLIPTNLATGMDVLRWELYGCRPDCPAVEVSRCSSSTGSLSLTLPGAHRVTDVHVSSRIRDSVTVIAGKKGRRSFLPLKRVRTNELEIQFGELEIGNEMCNEVKVFACPISDCPPGFALHNETCFFHWKRTAVKIDDARADCRASDWLEDAHLAILSSADINVFAAALASRQVGSRYWLGLRRPFDSWDDGTPRDYSNWDPSQPGSSDCVSSEAEQPYRWTTNNCQTNGFQYVCSLRSSSRGAIWAAERGAMLEPANGRYVQLATLTECLRFCGDWQDCSAVNYNHPNCQLLSKIENSTEIPNTSSDIFYKFSYEDNELPVALIASVSDEQLSASSERSTYEAKRSRLMDPAGWRPCNDDELPFIQLTLDEPFDVTHVATQGGASLVVSTFRISYRQLECENFTFIDKTFFGNEEERSNEVKVSLFPQMIKATEIRLHPLTPESSQLALRWELYGTVEITTNATTSETTTSGTTSGSTTGEATTGEATISGTTSSETTTSETTTSGTTTSGTPTSGTTSSETTTSETTTSETTTSETTTSGTTTSETTTSGTTTGETTTSETTTRGTTTGETTTSETTTSGTTTSETTTSGTTTSETTTSETTTSETTTSGTTTSGTTTSGTTASGTTTSETTTSETTTSGTTTSGTTTGGTTAGKTTTSGTTTSDTSSEEPVAPTSGGNVTSGPPGSSFFSDNPWLLPTVVPISVLVCVIWISFAFLHFRRWKFLSSNDPPTAATAV